MNSTKAPKKLRRDPIVNRMKKTQDLNTSEKGGNPDVVMSKQTKNAQIGSVRFPKLNCNVDAGTKFPSKARLQSTSSAMPNKEHTGKLPQIHQRHLHGGNPGVVQCEQRKNAQIGSVRFPKLNCNVDAGTKLPSKARLQSTSNAKPNKEHTGKLPQIHQGHLHAQTAGKGHKGERRPCESRFMQEDLPGYVSTQGLCRKQEHERREFEGHQLPMTPIEVLNYFEKRLSNYEKLEITCYSEIWYLGLNAEKINSYPKKPCNYGYDDEKGAYIKVLHDHIAYRYEILGIAGEGGYGKAFKCLDHKTNEMVVVKMLSSKQSTKVESIEEVRILDDLRREDPNGSFNVIHMKDYFRFRNHLCITFELLGPSLKEVIKNSSEGLSEDEVRHYAQELLKCLLMLKRKRIIHGDLKPGNILLSENGNGRIKIIDFGCSRYEHEGACATAGTFPYSAPEMFLGQFYNSSFDMWSLACILAELYTGVRLFTGNKMADVCSCIMEVLGMPPSNLLPSGCTADHLFYSSIMRSHSVNRKGGVRRPGSLSLGKVLKTKSHLFLDFLMRCLTWDPAERLTPEEALRHEWIQQGHRQSSRAQALRKGPKN
ncbi:dual specificity tyrosine-phosphorylation-regulated kinase 4-like [Brachyhypopomus gauderio]|uniref:dual specificity tyrosine-phosphorylation-regulated kinase 4-like n=1 Tax=Brachyhypopomus gauderio TaxID=698409 RepID=UPI004041D5F3